MTQQGDTADSKPATGAPGAIGEPTAESRPAATLGAETEPGNLPQPEQAQQQPAQQEPAQQQQQPAQPQTPSQPQFPSPYLEAGESVPQAYPAPPQPGLPPFGSGRVPFGPGQGPQGFGQQPHGQQGNGQQFNQPYGQPLRQRPYGRPGTSGRPQVGMGQRPRRDPALAAGWERLLASLLDWVLILGVSVLIFLSPLLRIWRQLDHIANQYSDLRSPLAQTAVDNFAKSPATLSTLLHFWLAVFAISLAYFWVMHAVWGATLGKRALGVAVVTATDRAKIGVRAAGIRTVAFLLGPAIFLLVARLDYLGGIVWLSDNGLLLLDARTQTLHDKLAGTVVIKRRRLQQQTQQPRP